ncbi:YraN family protein [Leisingera aquimarina]|uniref:YraN family protein n=1 Tax=Leisingera aquimarina TaxID=476529 RepID=UPI0004034091|nr:YraN family protein [Leisingera aquimarina]
MTRARQHRGSRAHLAGEAAEEIVARHYENHGYTVAARRWRGLGGEIDLILRGPEELVFVEVKQSSSSNAAALRITPRQVERIYASAGQFLETEPQGQLTPVRFDAALVDGTGAVEVIENAFGLD